MKLLWNPLVGKLGTHFLDFPVPALSIRVLIHFRSCVRVSFRGAELVFDTYIPTAPGTEQYRQ